MIRVGIGGWVFKPWRGTFYPDKLPQARELEHASRAVTTIEINGTFYGSQKPASFRRWAEETPEDFVFSLKGPRFTTHRGVLAEAGPSVERFFGSGVLELKHKLGPVLWQLPPTKAFEPADFAAFLALLPHSLDGRTIRHVVEVRHAELLRAGIRRADAQILGRDRAGRFRNASADRRRDRRLRLCAPAAHRGGDRDRLCEGRSGGLGETRPRLRGGRRAGGLAHARARRGGKAKRDVFIYMISGAKVRAPAAAQALLAALK